MPQDRQTYSELDKTTWSYTPSLVRWRHRHKGVRESLKINQETMQILYDLWTANKRLDLLFKTMEDHAASLYHGREYDEVDYFYESTDDEPGVYRSVGIRDINDRLTRLDLILRSQGI